MLTLKLLREQPEFVIERLAVKNFDAKEIVATILDEDRKRRDAQGEVDSLKAQQNAKAKEIGAFMKAGDKASAEAAKAEVAALKERTKERKVQEAVLELQKKFGKNAVLKGINLEEGAMTIERNKP